MDRRYGDESERVCACAHLAGEHKGDGWCRVDQCRCRSLCPSTPAARARAVRRNELDQDMPDGAYVARPDRSRPPGYCRWCRHKLTVTRRDAGLCLHGGGCDLPDPSQPHPADALDA